MMYLISSFVALAAVAIVYFKYFRANMALKNQILELEAEIKALEEKNINFRIEAEDSLLLETKLHTDRIEELLVEIDQLRQEKELEVRGRLKAEKDASLAIEKTHNIEKRINEWARVQEAAIKDSTNIMTQIGEEIYKKLNRSHQYEIETNKNLITKFSQNIISLFEQRLNEARPEALEDKKTVRDFDKSVLRDFLNDASETFKSLDLRLNYDFFLAPKLEPEKMKLFLCELAVINENELSLIDVKACTYFSEYHRASRQIANAQDHLKQKLDKYFSYLGNQRYVDSSVSALPQETAEFVEIRTVIALQNESDIELLKSIHYYGKARKLGLSVVSFEDITKLIS